METTIINSVEFWKNKEEQRDTRMELIKTYDIQMPVESKLQILEKVIYGWNLSNSFDVKFIKDTDMCWNFLCKVYNKEEDKIKKRILDLLQQYLNRPSSVFSWDAETLKQWIVYYDMPKEFKVVLEEFIKKNELRPLKK